MTSSRSLLLFLSVLLAFGCKARYRVGDYVLVEWCDGEYPAYILSKKGRTHYRVHFDGYEKRWDTVVDFDRIKRRLEDPPESMPPLCDQVARAMGIQRSSKDGDSASRYEEGARVTVSWRGGVYKATIIEVLSRERFKVHYEGHETYWDEVITSDRIVSGAR